MQITTLRRLLLFVLGAGTLFWSTPLPAEQTGTRQIGPHAALAVAEIDQQLS